MPSSAPLAQTQSWTGFEPLRGAPSLSPATLAELIDGGQAFRWQSEPGGTWLGVWSDHLVRLRLNTAGGLEWSAPSAHADRTGAALFPYLFGHDTPAALDALPWRSDPHLARCLATFPGLTILRQPFGETLLGFLCSATKQIVQIKQMIALLAARHGHPILPPQPPLPPPPPPATTRQVCHVIRDKPSEVTFPETDKIALNRLPTWAELAAIPEADLRACLLGFRARYIHQTAQFIAARPGWLEETERLSYPEAKARLCELPGVGEKVADCVLLFGAGKPEAFPVDTWIIKAMARRYGLDGWTPAQIAHFGRTHFGAHAGLAQQYLFAYERAQGRSVT